jgi:hypothetical protein
METQKHFKARPSPRQRPALSRRAVALYARGVPVRRILRALRVSPSTLYPWLSAAGCRLRRDALPPLRERLDAGLALLRTGLNQVAAARRVHVTTGALAAAARTAGVPPQRFGRPCRPLSARTGVLRLLDGGATYAEAAAALAVRPACVGKVLGSVLPPPAGPCAMCGKPAGCRHHLTYVPEITVALCRACHCRLHTLLRHHAPRR